MFCKNCGKEIAPSDQFCQECGERNEEYTEPVVQAPVQQANTMNQISSAANNVVDKIKKVPVKILAICGAGAVALIMLIAILAVVFTATPKSNQTYILSIGSNGDTVFTTGSSKQIKVTGSVNETQRSLDGKTLAVLVYDSGTYTLYAVTEKSADKVAEDVNYFRLSDNGSTICYFKDVENSAGILTSYNVSSKKSEKVAADAYVYMLALSPDGKSVAYSTNYEYDYSTYEATYKTYISTGGKATEFGKNLQISALSNGAKVVYYYNPRTGAYSVRKGGNDERLGSSFYDAIFNKDRTQVIYNDGDSTFISDNGASRVKLTNSAISKVFGPYANTGAGYTYSYSDNTDIVYDISSFKNALVGTSYSLYQLTNKLELNTIIKNGSDVCVSPDGKKAAYIDDRYRLRVCNNIKAANFEFEIASASTLDSVYTLRMSHDGKTFYLLDNYNTLYKYTSGKPVKISDDVYGFVVSPSSNLVFFVTDYSSYSGVLYTSSNGGAKKKVDKGGDTYRLFSTGNGVIFRDNDDNLYFSSGGAKFTKLLNIG